MLWGALIRRLKNKECCCNVYIQNISLKMSLNFTKNVNLIKQNFILAKIQYSAKAILFPFIKIVLVNLNKSG